MKIKNLPLLIVACCAAMLFSCKKDIDTVPVIPPTGTEFNIPAASPVTGRVSGIVVDENNAPVPNAAVVLAGSTYTTDANGFFNTGNKVLDKYVTTVTVTKAGYFKAFRSFSATQSRNYLSIKLIPKTLAGSVDAVAGGSVSLSNGTGITMQANGIVVKGTNVAYTGPVNVYAAYIDPTSSDISSRVPGSMMGQDAEHMFVLQSTGMIAVDLESPGGQALQLATGKTANISLPIPASLLSKAPATIDTWSLDDRGVWIKEGTATKNGSAYDMQVTHFSFWNTDAPCNAVYLTLNVHDQNGNPLPNTFVTLSIPNSTTWWATTHGYTDSSGTVSGLVPSNQGLVMSISPNVYNCASVISTQNIGPFSSDTTLNVTVTLNANQYTVISGTVNGCNDQPLANGSAAVYTGYNVYNAPVTNGHYTITVPYCSSITSLTVIVSDSANGYASSGPVTITGNNITVPLITLCSSTQNAAFTITSCMAMGSYATSTSLNFSNYIVVYVNVTLPGHYDFPVVSANGIEFSGSGDLTQIGSDTIMLQGSGTPLTGGNMSIGITSGGQNCTVNIPVNDGWGPAVFSVNCTNAFIAGDYVVGFPTTGSNNVTLMVNVTVPGNYFMATDSVNGIMFTGQGVFPASGVFSVVLTASGTPTQAGNNMYAIEVNGAPGCSFQVTTVTTGSSADYTFLGAPGTCANASVSGTYQVGVPLTGQHTVTLMVEVTSVGSYSIATNSTNGMSFTATGVFSSTGVQAVTLLGTGTPANVGINTYIPTGGPAQGCLFTVTTN